ncbi:Huntington interacting protein related 1 [Thelohanellus kitauei]|uniref:Huntington interacting protein related 1 n=1 Tax=Thelohanellus kitauei TaxID=669202 RepID=A0A0C2J999_THEKT|nr:Huntington interacting protein related 1 [Thelohanellus kitauei]
MAEYSFVTDRYRLPQLPDVFLSNLEKSYPFLVSPAQDMNKTPTPPLILTPSPEKLQEPKNENEPCVLFIPSPLETPPTEITTDMLMVDLRTRSLSPTLSYGGGDYQQIKELEHKLKEQEDLVAQNHEYMEQVSNLQERITSCTKANEILRKRLDSMMMTSQENEQFRKKYETISDMYSELRTKYKSVCETKSITSQQTTDALMENQKLREKIAELQTEISELVGINSLQSEKIADLQNQLKEAPSKSEKLLLGGLIKSLASCSLEAFENFIQNPPITDSISKTQFLEFLKNISQNISAIGYEVCEDNNEFDPMINFITRFQQIMMQLHDNTNKFLKVTYDEEIEKILEGMQEHYICSVKDISENPNSFKFSQFISQFQRLHEFLLMKVNEKPETFANLIDNYMEYDVEEELQNLTNLIDGAKSSLINADIHKDSIKENELQTIKGCGKIFDILKKLIQSAQKLEMDIKQSQEAKPADKNSYYAKNSAWAKGLYGFAQSIAPAVKVLVDSANGFVSGETIVEELTVSMNNVSSLVTQLFVSARSRADRGNPHLNEMGSTVASLRTEINEITNNAKMSSAQEEFTIPDLSKMGKSAIISREREMQVLKLIK